MKVYFIYALMSDETINTSNYFGQYDRFKYSQKIPGTNLNCILWAFTRKKKIRDLFFKERPVEKRYYEKIVDMEEIDYEEYLNEHFTMELLPTALDNRANIGDRSGYHLSHDTELIRNNVPKDKEKFFTYRIMTIKEYSYVTSNLGEICNEYKRRIFDIFELPLTSNIFVPEIRHLLDSIGYNVDALTYHPDAIKYMEADPEAKSIMIQELTNHNSKMYYNHVEKVDLFSVLNLFYITYAELIFRGDEEDE